MAKTFSVKKFKGPLAEAIIEEKRLAERRFCVCAYADPTEALLRFGYIDPGSFLDEPARAFWTALLNNGGDAMKAADDSGVLLDIMKAIRETPDLSRIEIYAGNLGKFSDMLSLSEGIHRATGALTARDPDEARAALQSALSQEDNRPWEVDGADALDIRAREMLDHGFEGSKTGLSRLDRNLRMLVAGQASILAARTSLGKTALACQIALHNCYVGKRVLYVTTDLSADMLWLRLAAGQAEVDLGDAVAGELSAEDQTKLKECSQDLAERLTGTWYCSDTARTFEQVYQLAAKVMPDLLIVDHLDDFTSSGGGNKDSKVILLADLYENLRVAARKLGHHMMAVHQLNRGADDRDDAPLLADLRWSGDLEQKADTVIFIHRPKQDVDAAPGLTMFPSEIWVRKNRIGPRDVKTGVVYSTLTQQFYDDMADPKLNELRRKTIDPSKPRF